MPRLTVHLDVKAMNRSINQLLTRALLILTLIVTGAATSAAQLTMAAEMASATEMVICGDGEALVVTLNAAGEPVAPNSPSHCSDCPLCCQAAALALPTQAPTDQTAGGLSDAEQGLKPLHLFLTRTARPVQARAPPKEL